MIEDRLRGSEHENPECATIFIVEEKKRFPSSGCRFCSALRKLLGRPVTKRVGEPIPVGELGRELTTHLVGKRVPCLAVEPALPVESVFFLVMTMSAEDVRVEVFGEPVFRERLSALAGGRPEKQSDDINGRDVHLSFTFRGHDKVQEASDLCESVFRELLPEGRCRISIER